MHHLERVEGARTREGKREQAVENRDEMCMGNREK
jgi:hypothetical protein